jgi:hypothetical protein
VGVECVLPSPEDIRALAAADLPNEFAAVPGPTNDFFERHSVPDERRDCGIGLLAPQIAFILEPFRTGEQLWIDCRCTDGGTDQAHGAAYGFEEGCADRLIHGSGCARLRPARSDIAKLVDLPRASVRRTLYPMSGR